MPRIHQYWTAGREIPLTTRQLQYSCRPRLTSSSVVRGGGITRIQPLLYFKEPLLHCGQRFVKRWLHHSCCRNSHTHAAQALSVDEIDHSEDQTARPALPHHDVSFDTQNTDVDHRSEPRSSLSKNTSSQHGDRSGNELEQFHNVDRAPHTDVETNQQDLTLAETEHDFASSSGFWSLHQFDPDYKPANKHLSRPVSVKRASREEKGFSIHALEAHLFRTHKLKQLWRQQARPTKIDLSDWHSVSGERKETYSMQPKLKTWPSHVAFRAGHDSRDLVTRFIKIFYRYISSGDEISAERVTTLLKDPAFKKISQDTEAFVNLMTWSWLLLSPPRRRFKRLSFLMEPTHNRPGLNIPLWLIQQLLRSDNINSQDLSNIVRLIKERQSNWQWSGDSPILLTVRLLRHARHSDPAILNDIVECFSSLLDRRFTGKLSLNDLRTRTHWCNRILKLLAVPATAYPFRSVRLQQDAQLLLASFMQESDPKIPLNREGYRALVQTQMMHQKTPSERAWTKVQADTWPPWEQQHQMGVTITPRERTGGMSRSNKVLFRMREDGYGPHSFDVASQILGGRDLDGSPTLHVRRKSSVISHPTLWTSGHFQQGSSVSQQVWAARITATRTIREAWMGFCAYKNASNGTKRSHLVYHAFYRRLMAKTLQETRENGPLAGDGLENFPDPELARDRVYVPEEVPTRQEFYNRMIKDDVRPSGQFLCELLHDERDFQRGLRYINDSSLDTDVQRVLSAPMQHSSATVAIALKKLPKKFVQAYIVFLAQPHLLSCGETPTIGFTKPEILRNGPCFAGLVLRCLGTLDHTIWNRYFYALQSHTLPSNRCYLRCRLIDVWKLMCETLNGKLGVTPQSNALTFRYVSTMAFAVQSHDKGCVDEQQHGPMDVTMRTFIEAVSGIKPGWLHRQDDVWERFVLNHCKGNVKLFSTPSADAIQDFSLLMAAAQEPSMAKDILNLLKWTLHHKSEIGRCSTLSKRNLAAFRVYLEGSWARNDVELSSHGFIAQTADVQQIEEARVICDELGGWASDEDAAQYLHSSGGAFARIKTKLKKARAEEPVMSFSEVNRSGLE